jgi:hypothetical protein
VALSKRWKLALISGSPALLMIQGRQTAQSAPFSRGFPVIRDRTRATTIKSAGEPDFAIGVISSPRWEQDTEQQRRPSNDRVPGNKTER